MAEIRDTGIAAPGTTAVPTGPTGSTVPTGSTASTGSTGSPGDSGGARERAEAVAGQAGTAASQVKEEAVGVAAEVKEHAGSELASLQGEAKAQVRNLAHEAKDRIGSQADDTTKQLASTISGAGRQLRAMAERSDDPDSPVVEVVRQLADRTEVLANRLENGGYRAVADDLARLGRGRPGLFLLAAGAAGFAVGRLLRNTDTSSITQAVKGDTGGEETFDADAVPAYTAAPTVQQPVLATSPQPALVGAYPDVPDVAGSPNPAGTYAAPLDGPNSGRI